MYSNSLLDTEVISRIAVSIIGYSLTDSQYANRRMGESSLHSELVHLGSSLHAYMDSQANEDIIFFVTLCCLFGVCLALLLSIYCRGGFPVDPLCLEAVN